MVINPLYHVHQTSMAVVFLSDMTLYMLYALRYMLLCIPDMPVCGCLSTQRKTIVLSCLSTQCKTIVLLSKCGQRVASGL